MDAVAGRVEVERVLRALEPRVRGLARRCLGRRGDADDVAQEVHARALAGSAAFRGEADLKTWIYRIAANVIADLMRSPFRRRRRPLADRADSGPGPGEAAERRETRDAVRRAVAALPPEQRIVLVLREYEGLRYREIAAIVGIPLGTVESRLHAARLRVARELSR
ncbi:MAG: RNA polymerase sigma factor [Planctomycetota bacterium]